ncbi:uncharacterized protein TRUGW13939_00670 [Talaromyces rugulosus]|uniref:Uncharacterized protein n=1 Tax=Talaromyces rugulosus TaxID=121627 RepID=A0A7H8QJ74_TALRU|nr:uncharacterized protein TRUGW13939_00670 [Talaromyces rugulosus]QKX53591.1 hypothetical protein TRUGW13939_00670 [Talaromyces rugulosus]
MAPTKPTLHPLKTPKNTAFPSEIQSATPSSISDIKSDPISTPITPPLAYTEFLKAMTPVFTSPSSPGVSFPRYPIEKISTPTSQPASATLPSFAKGETVKSATFPPKYLHTPLSAKSPIGRRRMKVSPIKTSFKGASPTTKSPLSASALRSPYTQSEWKLRYVETPRSACGKSVSVKQVVTRTVTYKRTPLEQPPKGKRRKTTQV